MSSEYVEQRDGGYYVAGTRVSLASIVYQFRDGAAAETIRQNFSTLTLEQVYGAIAFFLGHEQQVECYLRTLEEKWKELERNARPVNPDLDDRLQQARRRLLAEQA
jgi:uncharacterized protein (DUF433 family)